MVTIEEVYTELKQVFDPEIPVNIVDLGFIYDIKIEEGICKVEMTLTSKTCPEAQNIPDMVRRRANTLEGITETEVQIVWEPEWSPHSITAAGREILGMDDD